MTAIRLAAFSPGRPVISGLSLLVAGFLVSCQQETTDTVTENQTRPVSAFSDIYSLALDNMGAQEMTRIEYSGNGWEACLGQPWHIDEGWARWSIADYNRVIDYATFNSTQTALRQSGLDPDKLGGCGAQPLAAAQNQQISVNSDSSWEKQLQVHLTPLGFLHLANDFGGQVELNNDGLSVNVSDINVDDVSYRMVGSFGDDYLLDHVATWIDNTVYGDMIFEVEFSEWQDFAGVKFPTRIVQKQGGYSTHDLTVTSVIPSSEASAEPPPGNGGRFGGGQQADLPPYEAIGDGIYALHGAYQSVVMEFDAFSVVLDGLQNDTRAQEIIALTKELIPDKPIGYVLTSHNHFDHASGLRDFVAEGATIITHEINQEFFESALANPRTLRTESDLSEGMPVSVLGVGGFFVLDDGSQRLEIYKLNDSLHADDVLIAYIPSIKTIVEADLMQPWINPVFGGGDHPFLIWFADELERIGIEYEQFVPIHRPSTPPLMTRMELLEAVGRN
ncbi:MAG: MBL fold metallo-hydrolase [Gammaproteobacteria bacterium]|nr:MBL fold metallo-hydrolase [Gammaproteobacteria bacterium]